MQQDSAHRQMSWGSFRSSWYNKSVPSMMASKTRPKPWYYHHPAWWFLIKIDVLLYAILGKVWSSVLSRCISNKNSLVLGLWTQFSRTYPILATCISSAAASWSAQLWRAVCEEKWPPPEARSSYRPQSTPCTLWRICTAPLSVGKTHVIVGAVCHMEKCE